MSRVYYNPTEKPEEVGFAGWLLSTRLWVRACLIVAVHGNMPWHGMVLPDPVEGAKAEAELSG
jgi:hypothetical protein